MAGRYAQGTSVPAERSRAEVERTLSRYGASGFGYAWDRRTAKWCGRCKATVASAAASEHEHYGVRAVEMEVVVITFHMRERTVRLEVPMPHEGEAGTKARAEAATRQRWRALVLVLKAKLEAVESGIGTIESEFLANMVLSNGMTIGQAILPRLSEAVSSGRLLPAAAES